MRAAGSLLLLTFILTLICNFAPAAQAAQSPDDIPEDAIGTVVYMAGKVVAEHPGEDNRMLDLEKPVRAGDIIVTGSRSSVEIVFNDQSVFSQGADSRTTLDKFVYANDPSASKMLLNISVGTVRFVTGKIVEQNPDAFALTTPTATIGIRGTGIFARVSRQRETIGVLSMTPGHTVSVTSDRQTQIIDRPGLSVTVTPDGHISPPEPTDPDTQKEVVRAAPQTDQGERPALTSVTPGEINNRIDALKAAASRTKSELGGLQGRPNYSALHSLSLQRESMQSAESESNNMGGRLGAGLGGDSTAGQGADEGGGGGYATQE
ncbi:FecR family protein [uncultured Pseudodesulfovibrio sp.]|uniref:FecR family protein n=1 Tax=uncultured Pseudodesulfovibrio sp. TaxID=2035858 RepID=UPI0029C99472|nr:FecR family protein [uncultured Pseudodesulfovibrio sp.]